MKVVFVDAFLLYRYLKRHSGPAPQVDGYSVASLQRIVQETGAKIVLIFGGEGNVADLRREGYDDVADAVVGWAGDYLADGMAAPINGWLRDHPQVDEYVILIGGKVDDPFLPQDRLVQVPENGPILMPNADEAVRMLSGEDMRRVANAEGG